MSSYVDEDTARAVDAGRETAASVLASVQYEAKKVFAVFVVFFLGAVISLRVWIWDFLRATIESEMDDTVAADTDIIAVTPFDVILMQIKIGLILGVVAAAIAALYLARTKIIARVEQTVEVTTPRLYGFVVAASALAIGGMAYAYGAFFPLMFMVLAEQAHAAGVKPSYGIVEMTEFLLLLTISFGIAAQLPLLMGLLAFTEIVPYETFRDKWRYAVMGIFVFGAVFSPPDPFTQILWAIPLIALYAFSLGVAKVVTNVHRAGDRTDVETGSFRQMGYHVAGAGGLTFVVVVIALGTGLASDLAAVVFAELPASVEVPSYGEVALPTAYEAGEPLDWALAGARVAVVAGALMLVYHLVTVLRMPVVSRQHTPVASAGAPEDLDLTELDAAGVRAAPPEAFAALSEDEAVEMAGNAMEAGDDEKGKLILQRWEEVDREGAVDADAEAAESSDPADLDLETADAETIENAHPAAFADLTEDEAVDLAGKAMEDGDDEKGSLVLQRWEEVDRMDEVPEPGADEGGDGEDDPFEEGLLAGTTAGVLDAFTAEERDEDDIGGYLYDIGFILDSLRSRMFVIFGVFLSVFVGTFAYLYTMGIEHIMSVFISRVDNENFEPEQQIEGAIDVVIALHPVEVLIFIVKFSGVLAIIVTLPLLLYYAWPSIQSRGLSKGTGDRRGFLLWGGIMIATTLGGALLGFFGLSPIVISYLVNDAVNSGMVISYRIKSFLWVIFFMTFGIGLILNVPMGMLMLHYANLVRFETFRRWWRQVLLGVFVGAMFLTPSGVLTMVLFAIPIGIAYMVGLGLLWVLTAPATLVAAIKERVRTARQ